MDPSDVLTPSSPSLLPSGATGAPAEVPPPSGELIDADLARLLSRLAALQDQAVPVHRFGMMSVTLDGTPLDELDRALRARQWWTLALPGGRAGTLSHLPGRRDLPALWVSEDGSEARLLRGPLPAGGYAHDDASGATGESTDDEIATGTILVLRPPVLAEGDEEAAGRRSARDWFLHALRRRRGMFLEAVLATALMSVLALGASFYSMQVYDRVAPVQAYSTLVVLSIGTLMAILLELFMKQVRSQLVDRACKAIDEELSGVFFGKVLAVRMDMRPRTVGTFASQVRQFEQVRGFMTSSTLFLLADAPFALFFIAVIWLMAGPLALVPLLLLPVSLLAGSIAHWRLSKLTEAQLREANQKNGLLIEAIDGIEAVKAAGGEWKMEDRWHQLTAAVAEKDLRTRAVSTLAVNLTQTIQQVSYVLLIAAGVYGIGTGSITMGALMACSIISNRALGPIAQLAGIVAQWQQAKAALKGLDELMALPSDREPGERRVILGECAGRLRMEEAAFAYDGNLALQHTNLSVEPGERIAVLGSVGSGKSTMIKLMSGLYRPGEGRVFLDGVDMTQVAPESLREHIGYLTQDVRLFSGTLRENLTLGLPSPTDAQILAAARRTGLDRAISTHPKGLDLPIFEGGRGLSGGQRQLVGLTRLLLARPRLLLLDEPTASMDGDLENVVMRNLVEGLAPDSVLLLATHKLSMLPLMTRIIVMDRGRIVLDGPRDEVLARMRGTGRKPAAPGAAAATDAPPAATASPAAPARAPARAPSFRPAMAAAVRPAVSTTPVSTTSVSGAQA